MIHILTETGFEEAVRDLTSRDSDLATVVAAFGPPKLRLREPGFATLVLLILEQQVSLASARATHDRLASLAGEIAPAPILAIDDDGLRAAGLSRQKARYVRILAAEMESGALELDGLAELGDDDARARLTAITGIGAWTADVYLMTVERRADIWPAKDLALAVAAAEVKKLPRRPAADELVELGEAWRPWRAVAARILWHHYLNTARTRRRERQA